MSIPAERGYGMIGARESAFDMADVFVSYTRDDRNIARQFATGLEREGFSVWWDQAIHAGEAFDRTTEHALAHARAVVVLWSKRSVKSDWVRAEATEARATGRLIPVMIEPCKRPVIFELIHTADLAGWSGDATDARWRTLIDDLRSTIGQARDEPGLAQQDPVATKASRRGVRPGVALGIAAGLLAVAGLVYWTQFPRSGNLTPTPATAATPAVPVTQTGVTALAPDSWMVQRERAFDLFAEGRWAEAIAVAKAVMESSPRSWEQTYPYTHFLFAVGRLEETVTIVGELLAIEPLAMFMSRDQQWNLIALRRYDDAEAEYQRSRTLSGNRYQPEVLQFVRLLSREDTPPQALREQFRRMRDSEEEDLPRYLQALEPVLGDRQRMLQDVRSEFATHRTAEVYFVADALGDADLALTALRSMLTGRSKDPVAYEVLWIAPYSAMRTLPGFKAHMIETGLADYWRQTGDWGDVCKPISADDFECG
jgi:tetratricopeptide (TPR) repeat protein